MDSTNIRPIAICVFHSEGRILVSRGYDSVKDSVYYRPLGGGIEFGERSRDAVVREIREELSAEVRATRILGTRENIFTLDGETGHEILWVYDAEFVDEVAGYLQHRRLCRTRFEFLVLFRKILLLCQWRGNWSSRYCRRQSYCL